MSQPNIAQTRTGAVEGRMKDGTLLFSGIPYAAAPEGSLRFRPAAPVTPWTGVRPALKFGPAAPQVATGGLTNSAAVRWSEDCLSLNVCTPALDGALRPVLVWIHGGSFRTGQGAVPWYNGNRFALHGDMVVVSINYRLGALGFSELSRLGSGFETSGVNGLLDQIRALEWVRDNIQQFGGDPDRVTIAGESAGAFSVCSLLGSPLAQGLFHRAIAQSGAAHHTLRKATAERITDLFLESLGIDDPTDLDSLPVERILDAQTEIVQRLEDRSGALAVLGELHDPVGPFYPCVGNAVLPQSPIEAIRSGSGASIPLLIGTNADEATLWGYGDVPEQRLHEVVQAYNASAPLETLRAQRPKAATDQLMIALTTDFLFRIPAIRVAEARAGFDTATWMYLFSWKSRAFGGRLGATHALEIPFVFDNLDRAGVDIFLGEGPTPQALADVMHRAWIRFVQGDDPGWERYEPGSRATMRFDDPCELIYDPDREEREAWDGYR
ncbi:MAG TPA: carboxylesterase/lipase family protein [Pseudomonadales bacterium]|jgi:para-nitrobenzyl esterase